MIYAQTDDQKQEALQAEMKVTKDAKWYRRLKIIDLSSQGHNVTDLAQMFDLSASVIRSYIHAFNEGGLDGLRPGYGQGRPLLLAWGEAQWLDLLAQAPADLEQLATGAQNWTQALLRQYLHTYHQCQVSQGTISKALHRVGIRWRRAKLRVYSPDPLYVVKRQRVQELEQLALAGDLTSEAAAHPRSDEPPRPATLVFLDSTDLHWCPDLGSTYVPVGQQLKVDTPGLANPWYALFGSLHFPSGEGLYSVHKRKRADELLEHLQLLIDFDPNRFWFVVLDNASAHTTPAVAAFAETHQRRLELVYLPTYSPHLNHIERLWRLMRSKVTRNRFYESLVAVAEAAVDWLNKLPIDQFCSLMGVNAHQLAF
ncbi:MAG: IS630 family transposase, partial [Caldilineaceae bacterium]|nr:IS630 family transposase [Caldilineaceae bacterium]